MMTKNRLPCMVRNFLYSQCWVNFIWLAFFAISYVRVHGFDIKVTPSNCPHTNNMSITTEQVSLSTVFSFKLTVSKEECILLHRLDQNQNYHHHYYWTWDTFMFRGILLHNKWIYSPNESFKKTVFQIKIFLTLLLIEHPL